MHPNSNGITQEVPLAQLAQLVTQYQHRLLSLEAELQEHSRGGVITENDFNRRLRAIHAINADLRELSLWSRAQTSGEVTTGDIGLPIMGMCTPSEARVCAVYVKEKGAHLKRLRATAERAHKWLQDALLGRVGSLIQTLRLSKLRQMILATERSTAALREREVTLARQVMMLLEPGEKNKNIGLTTLQALKTLFKQIDASTLRIAKLTASVKREEQRTQEMRAWLEQERRQRAEKWPPMEAPTPLMMVQSMGDRSHNFTASSVYQKRRVDLAEQFLNDAAGAISGGAESSAAEKAAHLLAEATL